MAPLQRGEKGSGSLCDYDLGPGVHWMPGPGFSGNAIAPDFSLLSIEVVPEPATAMLLSLGVLMLLGVRWASARRAPEAGVRARLGIEEVD